MSRERSAPRSGWGFHPFPHEIINLKTIPSIPAPNPRRVGALRADGIAGLFVIPSPALGGQLGLCRFPVFHGAASWNCGFFIPEDGAGAAGNEGIGNWNLS